ncbi:conserved hypothetical protein [Histoplasma capsulatum H143]|uniref:Uncharacterized protein n=1 Tax=Ajellomyces capsulatus (strain H143) TaxID=544712 RepID=C6H8H9_AJECH|nr:conserved hypothetical protein [Histoplasma capsulatum H143]
MRTKLQAASPSQLRIFNTPNSTRPAPRPILVDHDLTMRNKKGGKMEASSTDAKTNATRMTDQPAMKISAKRTLWPEKPEDIRTRTLVISAFWAIIIFLGLPMWWRTTSIYRARLPLDVMKDWADGKVGFKRARLLRDSDIHICSGV